MCVARGLSAVGSRADLIRRLLIEDQNEDTSKWSVDEVWWAREVVGLEDEDLMFLWQGNLTGTFGCDLYHLISQAKACP